MANATTPDTSRRYSLSGVMREFEITDSTTVYYGRFAAIQASSGLPTGRIGNPTDASGVQMLGIIVAGGSGPDGLDAGGADTIGSTGVTGNTSATTLAPRATVDIGGGSVAGVTVTGASTIAHVGRRVYLSTNNLDDLTLTPTTHLPHVGWIDEFDAGTDTFTVRFRSADDMAEA